MSKRKIYCFYIFLVLFGSSAVSYAVAPPHPRLYQELQKQGLDPEFMMSPMLMPQLRVDDIPREGYKPQPDGIEYVLALRVDFKDQPGEKPASVFDNAIFGTRDTSMRLYFEEVSYGKMQIQTGYLDGVMPRGDKWYRMQEEMGYYGTGTIDAARYKEMVMEACAAADPEVDFSRYDRDGDGFVDHLFIIHAGNDQAATNRTADIWSAAIDMVPGLYDGVGISSAIIIAEDPMNDFINIGIYCHEFFHEFGAPDLYSFDYPVGHWCLMGRLGPYQDDGRHPSHICGYLKWDFDADPRNGITGWIEPIQLEFPGTYYIDSFEHPAGDRLYKIDIPGKRGKEYFLIENRNQRSGGIYDTYLPESGIVIWHIDEEQPKSFSNPYRAWVEDPSDPNRMDFFNPTAGAAYSLDDGQTDFTPATLPGSDANDGVSSGIIITNISEEGPTMSFTFFSGDTYEPNDSITEAFGPIIFGRKYISYITDNRDTDFYKLLAGPNRNLLFYLEDIPEDANYDLQVFDSSGRVLATSRRPKQEPEILSLEIDQADAYYIEVIPTYGYSADSPYSLTVESTPLNGEMIIVSKVYPNPSLGTRDGIWFEYKLLTAVNDVTLDIYTPAGVLIHTHNTPDVKGSDKLFWDGANDAGQKVASGIYIYAVKVELNGKTDTQTGKIAILY